jgi:hypothetical protein
MLVKQAKAIARRWVIEEATKIPGFSGAFYHGSSNWLPDEAFFPATSDLDIMVVLADPIPPDKPGKFFYQDLLLEISYIPLDELQSTEEVLSQSHLAGSFHKPNIILDPTGQLTSLQAVVSKNFAKREWVYKRCEHARDKILNNLQVVNEAELLPDKVMAWLFGTGVTTHVLLVAGLKNPTVRKRYVAVKELLAEYNYLHFYNSLLELLDPLEMCRRRVEQHLEALTELFDVTKGLIKTPFFFASDISDIARPIVIEGSRELIEQGYHREALFWIAVTYSRCQKILYHDAPPEIQNKFNSSYGQLLEDLGVNSLANLYQRSEQVNAFLPAVGEVAEVIIEANRDIEK